MAAMADTLAAMEARQQHLTSTSKSQRQSRKSNSSTHDQGMDNTAADRYNQHRDIDDDNNNNNAPGGDGGGGGGDSSSGGGGDDTLAWLSNNDTTELATFTDEALADAGIQAARTDDFLWEGADEGMSLDQLKVRCPPPPCTHPLFKTLL
jgi:hypothetical protein